MQPGVNQLGADSIALNAGVHRKRTKCVPTRCAIGRIRRREADVTNDLAIELGDKRYGEGIVITKFLDQFRLVAFTVGLSEERGSDEIANCGMIVGALSSDVGCERHAGVCGITLRVRDTQQQAQRRCCVSPGTAG